MDDIDNLHDKNDNSDSDRGNFDQVNHSNKIINRKTIIGVVLLLSGITGISTANLITPKYNVPDLPADKINSDYNNKLVSVSGNISDKLLKDPLFNIENNGLELTRIVEIYQYSQDNQSMIWSDNLIADQQNKNPHEKLINSESWKIDSIKLGKFDLSDDVKKQISQQLTLKDLKLSKEDFDKLSEAGRNAFKLIDGNFYFGLNPNAPELGDIRIKFKYSSSTTYTLVAKQLGNSLVPFHYKDSNIEKLIPSAKKFAQTGIDVKIISYPSLSWIIRVIFLLPVFIGFALIFSARKKENTNSGFKEKIPKIKIRKVSDTDQLNRDNLHNDDIVNKKTDIIKDNITEEKFTTPSKNKPEALSNIDNFDQHNSFDAAFDPLGLDNNDHMNYQANSSSSATFNTTENFIAEEEAKPVQMPIVKFDDQKHSITSDNFINNSNSIKETPQPQKYPEASPSEKQSFTPPPPPPQPKKLNPNSDNYSNNNSFSSFTPSLEENAQYYEKQDSFPANVEIIGSDTNAPNVYDTLPAYIPEHEEDEIFGEQQFVENNNNITAQVAPPPPPQNYAPAKEAKPKQPRQRKSTKEKQSAVPPPPPPPLKKTPPPPPPAPSSIGTVPTNDDQSPLFDYKVEE